jgi:type IV pilus assembly protein PilM
MGLFGGPGVVGLELDTGVIRAVEVRGSAGKGKLVAAGMVEIPEEAVVDGSVVNEGQVSEGLSRLWAEARFGSREVVLGTFNQGVITRMINFPKVPEGKLDQAIRLSAQEYFPIPLSQMVLDFAVVGEATGTNGPELEVLLVAARTSALEKSIKALHDSRLRPVVIDASPLALLRVLGEEARKGMAAVLDISNGLSSLMIVVEGVPRFTRVIPVSLRQYAARLGIALKEVPIPALGADESEPYAAAAGGTPEAFGSWALSAAEEIRSTLNYFLKLDTWPELASLVLCGPGARIPVLPKLLQNELEVAVEVVRPLDRVAGTGTRTVDRLVKQPDFAVCTGLALRGLEG